MFKRVKTTARRKNSVCILFTLSLSFRINRNVLSLSRLFTNLVHGTVNSENLALGGNRGSNCVSLNQHYLHMYTLSGVLSYYNRVTMIFPYTDS